MAAVRRIYEIANSAYRERDFPTEEAAAIFDVGARFDLTRNVFNPHVHGGIDVPGLARRRGATRPLLGLAHWRSQREGTTSVCVSSL